MKRWIRIIPLILVLFLGVEINDISAQYGKKRKKNKKKPVKKEEVDKRTASRSPIFTDHLWYGGGFNLNFSGSGQISIFNLGLAPMVGYKITNQFSAGPRIGINYSYIKGPGSDGRLKKVQPLSFEYGVFTRFKFLPILFAHLEGGFKNQEFIQTIGGRIAVDPATGNPQTVRETTPTFSFGLGYTSDNSPGYEILLLYDFLFPEENLSLPFDIRVGFNYKF